MIQFEKPGSVIIKPADKKHCSINGITCPFCVFTIQEDEKWVCSAYDEELTGKLVGFNQTVKRFKKCVLDGEKCLN